MNLLHSLWHFWSARQLPTSAAETHAKADVTTCMLTGVQQLCAKLPQGQAEVWVQEGQITFSVKWQSDGSSDRKAGEGYYFLLNGQNEEVKYANYLAKASDEETVSPEKVADEVVDETSAKHEAEKPSRQQKVMKQMLDYLQLRYAFRYNRLTDRTECAELFGAKEGVDNEAHRVNYQPVDNRVLNSISLDVLQAGIPCWDRDVKRYVESAAIPSYHPFTEYFEHLPAWDGVDRVMPLAQRVSDDTLWVKSFHRWMLATTAQWMKFEDPSKRPNSVAPLLVSTRQGLGKSTFCRMLLPTRLQAYFTESFDLTNPTAAEHKLASFGLINLDEFDRLPVSRMPQLKNLMQMERLNIRRAYKHSGEPLPRIASFIGTSNRHDLLTDRSGSRRFICVEVNHAIDCQTPIEYDQLYAQLKYELQQGERSWFSKEEEAAIQQANEAFYRVAPAEELLGAHFRFAEPGEEGAYLLSAAQIYTSLKAKEPAALQDCTPLAFSRLLAQLGKRVHTRNGNGYWVKVME